MHGRERGGVGVVAEDLAAPGGPAHAGRSIDDTTGHHRFTLRRAPVRVRAGEAADHRLREGARGAHRVEGAGTIGPTGRSDTVQGSSRPGHAGHRVDAGAGGSRPDEVVHHGVATDRGTRPRSGDRPIAEHGPPPIGSTELRGTVKNARSGVRLQLGDGPPSDGARTIAAKIDSYAVRSGPDDEFEQGAGIVGPARAAKTI